MINNATIISYTSPGVSDGNGGETPGTVTSLNCACTYGAPTRKQIYSLGEKAKDASASLRIEPRSSRLR
jgi:hypothetical protein